MSGSFETFGKYKLTERLAVGGMAEVFLGTIEGAAGFTKVMVIKRLHPQYSRDSAFIQMLIDEARLTSQLNHGNICQVYDLGQEEGSYFMAMEYIAGEDVRTLQDHCRRAGDAFPIAAAVFIVSETLAGLDYAHRKEGQDGPLGIIHRDVSPQNILISYEGEVKVIDFGIAKARTRMVKTEAGVIKGKFRYMSPEQASGLEVDHRTDIFAAGVVLYELLAGETHSLNLPDTEVLRRMRAAEFEPLRRRRSDIPGKLEKIVHKALKRKPSQRYATSAEFRAALTGFLQSMRVSFTSAELAGLMRKIFGDERRKRRSGSFSSVLDRVSASTAGRRASGSRSSGVSTGRLPGPLTATGTEQLDDEEEVEISTSALVDLDMDSTPAPMTTRPTGGSAARQPEIPQPAEPPARTQPMDPQPAQAQQPQARPGQANTTGWVAFAPTTPFGGMPGESGPLPEVPEDMDTEPTREVNMPPLGARPPQQYVHTPDDQPAVGDAEGTALFMSLQEDDLEFIEEGDDDSDEEPTSHLYMEQTHARRPSHSPAPAPAQQVSEQLAPAANRPSGLEHQATTQLGSPLPPQQPSVVVGPREPLPSEPLPSSGGSHLPSVIVESPEPRLHREPTSMLDPRRRETRTSGVSKAPSQTRPGTATVPPATASAPLPLQPEAPVPTLLQDQDEAIPPPPPKTSSGLRTLVGALVVLLVGGALAAGLLWWRPTYLFPATPDAAPRSPDAALALDRGADRSRASRPGQIRVRSKPAGANIKLCGKPTGKKTPATISLPAGKACDLVLSLAGHDTYRLPAAVLSETSSIRATLRRGRRNRRRTRPPAPRPRSRTTNQGTLMVTSVQSGQVYVNDQLMGSTPRLSLPLAPGRYRLRVKFPSLGRTSPTRIVMIKRGQRTTINVDPSSL